MENPLFKPPALKDVILREVQAKHSINKKLSLPQGTSLALRLDETLHPKDSRVVQADAVRKQTTASLEGPNQSVVWAETNGVAELGNGAKGTLPLGTFAKASAGFSGASLLKYHTLQPVVVPTGAKPEEVVEQTDLTIPLNRVQLLSSAPGAEYDLTGTGRVSANAAVSADTKASVGGVSVGASATVGAKIKHEGETSVNVRVLSTPGLVQLTLRKSEKTEERVGVDLDAGVKLPKVGQGFLWNILERELDTPIRKLAKTYTSASATVETKSASGKEDIGRYTLDIGSPDGLNAYKNLLQLSTGPADGLADIKGSGVSKAEYHETSKGSEFKAAARVSGKHLLLLNALENEKHGAAQNSAGKSVLFRENKYTHKTNEFIEGPKSATWDAISVKTDEGDEFANFYNMKFSALDKFTTDDEVARFFKFAELLGVRSKGETTNTLPEMGFFERIFSDLDDTTVTVDVYFTEDGINKIDACTRGEARHAYLSQKEALFPDTAGLKDLSAPTFKEAVKLSASFEDLQREKYLEDSGYDLENSALIREYADLTGRDIQDDHKTVLAATEFAQHVETLDGDNGIQNIRRFFTGVGKSQGTRFMTALAALGSLASQEETLVNTLAMEGKHIHLDTVSEGKLEHPIQTVQEILNERRFKVKAGSSSSSDDGSPV